MLRVIDEAELYGAQRYALSALRRNGFSGDIEIEMATKRAIAVCNGLGINSKRHFRYFYKVDALHRQATKEWSASNLGFYLVLCNGSPANLFMGALQIETLNGFLSKLE